MLLNEPCLLSGGESRLTPTFSPGFSREAGGALLSLLTPRPGAPGKVSLALQSPDGNCWWGLLGRFSRLSPGPGAAHVGEGVRCAATERDSWTPVLGPACPRL